jgi:hypothetical protein
MALQTVLFVDVDELAVDAVRVSETLDNLTHLLYLNEGDAGLVGLYARQLEERFRVLGTLLRSADPNLRDVRARLCN